MKILLLAGEESGELYAKKIRENLVGHEIRGFGDYGFRIADLAVMGFIPVLARLPYFLRVNRTMKNAIRDWQPDVVVTIDYPGLNLKLAAFAKVCGIPTLHVVCPQVWAWKAGRIPKIEAALDALCCFFPFEPRLFRPNFATFVGHPLVETFQLARVQAPREKRLVAILPGSRLSEINRNFPTMLDAFANLRDVRACVPAANEKAFSRLTEILATKKIDPAVITVQHGGARELLLRADVAMVASGTATLEAALARCPTVLVYRVSAALAWFARRVIKGIRHIGLINIVWEKSGADGEDAPMPELIQEDFTAARVAKILAMWLDDDAAREQAVAKLERACAKLSTDGSAFQRIIAKIFAIQSDAKNSREKFSR